METKSLKTDLWGKKKMVWGFCLALHNSSRQMGLR